MKTTYSFQDVNATISHPAMGQLSITGNGIGSITISMATDRTTHEVSADGSVMVSKVAGRNGSIALAIQQTSYVYAWLLKLYNYLEHAPTNQWAEIMVVVRAPYMQDLITATGVSFQKLPDKPYQAQGQQVTWQLMAADIQQDAV